MKRREENKDEAEEQVVKNCTAYGCKNPNCGGGLCEWHGMISGSPEKFDRLTAILQTHRHKQIAFYFHELQKCGLVVGGNIIIRGVPRNAGKVYRQLQARMIEYGVDPDKTFIKDSNGIIVPWHLVTPAQYAIKMRGALMKHITSALFGKATIPSNDIDPARPVTIQTTQAAKPYWTDEA